MSDKITLPPKVRVDFEKWYKREQQEPIDVWYQGKLIKSFLAFETFISLTIGHKKGVYEQYFRERGIEINCRLDSNGFTYTTIHGLDNIITQTGKLLYSNRYDDYCGSFVQACNKAGEILNSELSEGK
jgi:hypothetical protein